MTTNKGYNTIQKLKVKSSIRENVLRRDLKVASEFIYFGSLTVPDGHAHPGLHVTDTH